MTISRKLNIKLKRPVFSYFGSIFRIKCGPREGSEQLFDGRMHVRFRHVVPDFLAIESNQRQLECGNINASEIP